MFFKVINEGEYFLIKGQLNEEKTKKVMASLNMHTEDIQDIEEATLTLP